MGICATDLRELIIRPTLRTLNDWSFSAENLLMGTAAQESHLGFRIGTDINKGMGLYRISAPTHLQVWDQYLVTDPELASRMRGLASQQQFLKSPHHELIINLSYATGIAWMIYKRHKLQLAEQPSVHQLAHYWLDYYYNRDERKIQQNQQTQTDAARLTEFENHYRKLVLREPSAAKALCA
jgi:hypothetical protein